MDVFVSVIYCRSQETLLVDVRDIYTTQYEVHHYFVHVVVDIGGAKYFCDPWSGVSF